MGHKALKGPVVWYAGYPGLLKYSQFYDGKRVPSTETLREDLAKLERYILTKQRELEQIDNAKARVTELADEFGPIVGSAIRMCFRRTQQGLQHDIKTLEEERDMVRNAATEQTEREMRY